MNALAQSIEPVPHVAAVPLLRTLVLCDLVDSTALVERMGDQRAADLFRKHDRLARALVQRHGGREIDKTDGFLMMFDRPIQAVGFALDYQRALQELNGNEKTALASRVGVHVGDVLTWDNAPDDIAKGAKPVEVEGLVKPITSRLMQLALPNQILLSGVAHALAHRAQGELGEQLATVRWRTHGRYRFKGIPDPIPVFEVGEEGHAPLKPPPWSGKAHREIPFWRRPATMGIEIGLLLVLIAVPAWYFLKPTPAIAFANRDWVVVGDLKNLTGEAGFDEAIDTAFRIGLEQSRHVNVLSSLKTRATVKLMQQDPDTIKVDRAIGSEIAIRDGARALILPTIAEIGGRVRVTAEVVDPNTQTTVWSESADGVGVDSVLPSLDHVNEKLRVRLGEALATVSNESRPLAKVTTANLDALKAYSLGEAAYVKGDFKAAIALYTQAIQLDPSFALAHLDLGSVLSATNSGDTSEAVTEFRKAVAQVDRLSARDALYARASLLNFEHPKAALEKWRLLAKLYPDYTPATGALGYFAYGIANDFEGAIAATELNAVPTNPHRAVGDYLLGMLYLGQERYADSQRRFDLAKANGFDMQGQFRSYLQAAQRQFDQASATIAAIGHSGIATEDAEQWYPKILFAVDRGEWSQATSLMRAAEQDTVALKGTFNAQMKLVELSLRSLTEPVDAVKQALAARIETDSRAAAGADAQFGLLFCAYLAASEGLPDVARGALSHANALTLDGDQPYLTALRLLALAQLALASGHPDEALATLRPSLDGTEFYLSHRVLMDAYAAKGDDRHALEEANWLTHHRGRAYAEQFGQVVVQPMNVALSDFAWLNVAEYSLRLDDAKGAESAMKTLRTAWPSMDSLSFLDKRLQRIADAMAQKKNATH